MAMDTPACAKEGTLRDTDLYVQISCGDVSSKGVVRAKGGQRKVGLGGVQSK